MVLIETTQMQALRMAMEDTIHSLHQRAWNLTEQVDALQAQNRLLAGHVCDLLEMVRRLEAQLGREAA